MSNQKTKTATTKYPPLERADLITRLQRVVSYLQDAKAKAVSEKQASFIGFLMTGPIEAQKVLKSED